MHTTSNNLRGMDHPPITMRNPPNLKSGDTVLVPQGWRRLRSFRNFGSALEWQVPVSGTSCRSSVEPRAGKTGPGNALPDGHAAVGDDDFAGDETRGR